jgi:hypothetical protein
MYKLLLRRMEPNLKPHENESNAQADRPFFWQELQLDVTTVATKLNKRA